MRNDPIHLDPKELSVKDLVEIRKQEMESDILPGFYAPLAIQVGRRPVVFINVNSGRR